MKTIVTGKLRITKVAHDAIKKKANDDLCTQQSVIRKILHDWAMKKK